MEEKTRRDVVELVEQHPDASKKDYSYQSHALAIEWNGPNDVGFFKNLIRGGWQVTSISNDDFEEGHAIWLEKMNK
jgi:hypothetical protein